MAELLLELFSEEIPAGMQPRARGELERLTAALLGEADLAFEKLRSWATPRRLGIAVSGLPVRQPDRVVERRGPRVAAPEQARQGFLRSLEGLDYELCEREDRKGKILFARIHETGRPATEALAEALPAMLERFPWPKSMRWGEGEQRWVRPLRAILCLFDGEIVPFTFAGIASGRVTFGHRFMAPAAIAIDHPDVHEEALRGAFVIRDPEERERLIRDRAARLAAAEGLSVVPDEALFAELAGLVEWPVVLAGRIDPEAMSLPEEVLTVSMRQHQRYLALRGSDGRLAPRFLLVANIEARDGGAAIVAGNERVLRARLWDARFFWENDRRRRLEERLPELERVIFHARLGTMREKAERLAALAAALAPRLPGCGPERARRAGLLAKCDLVTGMVGEFPELQGIMGGHYARAQGEPEEIARAIAEHYAPQGPEDACPRAPESVAVALADKIDSLAGFFAAGIRPTGSKDPFALRRAALGIVRLVLENGLRLRLRELFREALGGYGSRFAHVEAEALGGELLEFLADRLVVHLRDTGVRHDRIRAVFGAARDDDLVRLMARVRALEAFLASEDGRNLLVAHRRAANIVAIEEKRDGRSYRGRPDPALFRQPEEERLWQAMEEARQAILGRLESEDFEAAMRALAALRRPVDAFFDRVRVNVEEAELRRNRLLLLARMQELFHRIADFSVVED